MASLASKVSLGQSAEFLQRLGRFGLTEDQFTNLLGDDALMKRMVDAIATKVAMTFTVLVDYVQPKHADLKSAFDWVDDDFARAEFQPIDRCKDVSHEKRDVTFEYMSIDRTLSTDAVLAQMDSQGLRPALYEELLAFAKANPDEQRKRPIVALGSVAQVDGDRRVACLRGGGGGRYLYLRWFDRGDGWDGFRLFLVVRK